MKEWLRRVRGAIGIGLTWGATWAPIGALLGAVLHVVLPGSPLGLGSVVALNAMTFGVLGFVGGVTFGGVLRLAEGRNRFHELSLPRFAGWGAVGGLLLGAVAVAAGFWGAGFVPLGAVMLGAATLLSAGSAAGSLVLARRADDPDQLSPGADGSVRGLKAS